MNKRQFISKWGKEKEKELEEDLRLYAKDILEDYKAFIFRGESPE